MSMLLRAVHSRTFAFTTGLVLVPLLALQACGRRGQSSGSCAASNSGAAASGRGAQSQAADAQNKNWHEAKALQAGGGFLVVNELMTEEMHFDTDPAGAGKLFVKTTCTARFESDNMSGSRKIKVWTSRKCLNFSRAESVEARVYDSGGWTTLKLTNPRFENIQAFVKDGKASALPKGQLAWMLRNYFENLDLQTFFANDVLTASEKNDWCLGGRNAKRNGPNDTCFPFAQTALEEFSLLEKPSAAAEDTLQALDRFAALKIKNSALDEPIRADLKAWREGLIDLGEKASALNSTRVITFLAKCGQVPSQKECQNKEAIASLAKRYLVPTELHAFLQNPSNDPEAKAHANLGGALRTQSNIFKRVMLFVERTPTLNPMIMSNYHITPEVDPKRMAYLAIPAKAHHAMHTGLSWKVNSGIFWVAVDGKLSKNFTAAYFVGSIFALDRANPFLVFGPLVGNETGGFEATLLPEKMAPDRSTDSAKNPLVPESIGGSASREPAAFAPSAERAMPGTQMPRPEPAPRAAPAVLADPVPAPVPAPAAAPAAAPATESMKPRQPPNTVSQGGLVNTFAQGNSKAPADLPETKIPLARPQVVQGAQAAQNEKAHQQKTQQSHSVREGLRTPGQGDVPSSTEGALKPSNAPSVPHNNQRVETAQSADAEVASDDEALTIHRGCD